MCVIIVSNNTDTNPRIPLTKEILGFAVENNPHGFGIAARYGDKIEVTKGFGMRNAWRLYQRHKDADSLVFHARIATSGNIDKWNIHPFDATGPDGRSRWFFHNGTIHGIPKLREDRSDSWHMARLLASMDSTKELMGLLSANAIKENSRYVLMEPEECWYFGTGWVSRGGWLYSNMSAFGLRKGNLREWNTDKIIGDKSCEITCSTKQEGLGFDDKRKLWTNLVEPKAVERHQNYSFGYANNHRESEEGMWDAKSGRFCRLVSKPFGWKPGDDYRVRDAKTGEWTLLIHETTGKEVCKVSIEGPYEHDYDLEARWDFADGTSRGPRTSSLKPDEVTLYTKDGKWDCRGSLLNVSDKGALDVLTCPKDLSPSYFKKCLEKAGFTSHNNIWRHEADGRKVTCFGDVVSREEYPNSHGLSHWQKLERRVLRVRPLSETFDANTDFMDGEQVEGVVHQLVPVETFLEEPEDCDDDCDFTMLPHVHRYLDDEEERAARIKNPV